jgi:hypothetical protein
MSEHETLGISQRLAEIDAELGAWGEAVVPRPPVSPRPPPDHVPRADAMRGGGAGVHGAAAAARRLTLSPHGGPQPAGGAATSRADSVVSSTSTRTPRLPRIGRGKPRKAKSARHAFMQRHSKSIPVSGHHMPQRNAKSSALVASISMHEQAFEVRRKAWEEQKKRQREEAVVEERQRQEDETARRRERLLQLRKKRVAAIAESFGLNADELTPEDLLHQEIAHDKKVERKRQLAAKRRRRREEEEAAKIAREAARAAAACVIQTFFQRVKRRRTRQQILAAVVVAQHISEREQVELCVERMINAVMRRDLEERMPLLEQIELLERRNRNSVRPLSAPPGPEGIVWGYLAR